jgi:hypothetical protein
VNIRRSIIVPLAALGFLLGWTATPSVCSAQGYCYPVTPVPYSQPYPLYAYSVPVAAPTGYYAVAPSPPPHKYKHRHRHHYKYKHRHKHGCY